MRRGAFRRMRIDGDIFFENARAAVSSARAPFPERARARCSGSRGREEGWGAGSASRSACAPLRARAQACGRAPARERACVRARACAARACACGCARAWVCALPWRPNPKCGRLVRGAGRGTGAPRRGAAPRAWGAGTAPLCLSLSLSRARTCRSGARPRPLESSGCRCRRRAGAMARTVLHTPAAPFATAALLGVIGAFALRAAPPSLCIAATQPSAHVFKPPQPSTLAQFATHSPRARADA